jgi:lipoprotein-anchoring transpeptidase ErfK/SrfK
VKANHWVTRFPSIQQSFMRPFAIFSALLLVACMGSPPEPSPAPLLQPTESAATPSATLQVQPPAQISPSAAWIEVDLAKQSVALHEGGLVVAEYPASTGVTSDARYATPPGLYHVLSKDKGPVEGATGVYVSDLIMFDMANGNGIHSRPFDANGNILDTTLGQPATAGCVRVGESESVFKFARIGMWIWIH